MKYMHFTEQISHLKCEIFGLKINMIQGSATELYLLLRQPGPTALAQSALLHSISLILHFPCNKFPEVSVKMQITLHYPQETKWPFFCQWNDTWSVSYADAKASTDLFSLNKDKYWKHI